MLNYIHKTMSGVDTSFFSLDSEGDVRFGSLNVEVGKYVSVPMQDCGGTYTVNAAIQIRVWISGRTYMILFLLITS